MKKIPNSIVGAVLLAIVAIFVAYPVWSNQVPDATAFKPMTPPLFTGLIAWLFALALFVERAVEVVVMVFRDQQADLLDKAEEEAVTALNDATKRANVLPGDNAAATNVQTANTALAGIRHDKVIYRAETKEIALLVGFAFGLFVSLAGVRALHSLLKDNEPVGVLFVAADILITGAILAGGSEGIHRIANAFNGFMDSLSARTDQIQRNAQKDIKPTP